MQYTILNAEGQTDRIVECGPEFIDCQLAGGESRVEGDYPARLYRFEDGKPVARENPRPPLPEIPPLQLARAVRADLKKAGVACPRLDALLSPPSDSD